MSTQVIAVNVQIPASTKAPIVADFISHALRVGYINRRDVKNLPRDEWNEPGVYVLMTANGDREVYVGKSVDLRDRMLAHDTNPKIAWQRAILCKRDTSHGFTSADIGYLEGRLASELGAVDGITVRQGKEDRDRTLPPHMELSLDELLSSILSAVRLAGLDTFKEADLPEEDAVPYDQVQTSPRTRTRTSKRIRLDDLVAAGLINAGTELHLNQGGTTGTGTVSTKGEIVVDGVAYASPSRAAQTALNSGRDEASKVMSSNGWITWRIGSPDGPTLDSLREQMVPEAD